VGSVHELMLVATVIHTTETKWMGWSLMLGKEIVLTVIFNASNTEKIQFEQRKRAMSLLRKV